MSVTVVLLSVVLALLVTLALRIYRLMPSARVRALVDKIPGPPTVPVFGNALMLKRGGAELMAQGIWLCEQFGEKGLVRLWLGTQIIVLVTKAETSEFLFKSSKHITKSSFYNFIAPWLGNGLLTSTGEKWHSRRKLITPTFHFKILEDFLLVFNEQSAVMQRKLDALVDKKQGFDIVPAITLCALDIICETAMGKQVKAQEKSDSDYVKAIYKISELIMDRMKRPWVWPDFIWRLTPSGREHDKLLRVLHKFTNDVITERTDELNKQLKAGNTVTSLAEKPSAIGGRKRLAFLDMLLYASQDNKLSNEDIREEVDTFMFEGHDTTAAAVSWAVHLIGSDPEVQDKLIQELDTVFGNSDRPVTMDDMKQLKYLECVIKEALRIYPSVPMIAREIVEDCEIGGYFVPKGATSIIITGAIHRDPDHFPDPMEFKPNRWLPENSADRHPFSFVPFSAGLRNCIGQRFAMMEEKVLISSILRKFRIKSLQSRDDIVPIAELIQRSEDGIKVRLERRQI